MTDRKTDAQVALDLAMALRDGHRHQWEKAQSLIRDTPMIDAVREGRLAGLEEAMEYWQNGHLGWRVWAETRIRELKNARK